jgi:hypothetical protein
MAQPDNHLQWLADRLARLGPEPFKGDYRALGARARSMADARRTRKRKLASAAVASMAAFAIILPVFPVNPAKPGMESRSAGMESPAKSAIPKNRKLAAAEIARLFAELQESRDRQRQLEQSWDVYLDRASSLARAQKKTIDDYLDHVASSNRIALAMLSAEKSASSRRQVDARRLQAIVSLYPGTIAAEEAGRMLAQGKY